MEKRCLCIDVGGTAIKYALIDDARNLNNHGEVPTPTDNTEHYLEVLEGICRQFNGQIRGVAMSVPGIIDSENGICITAGWLHYANGLHLGEELTKRTGLPVSVMNDAKAAGLVEAAWGSLSNCKDSVVILIGSGIGGGISRQKLFLESIQKNLDELYTIYPEKSFPRAQLTTCRFFNEANLYGAYRFFTEREKA